MKINLMFKTLFFFSMFFAAANFSYAQNSISGTVRYTDNLQVVTSGTVKAYDLNGAFANSGNINTDGTYSITGLGGNQYDVIGFPNSDPELDFPPTGFPSTINPLQIQPILAAGVVINKDVYVQRLTTGGGNKPKGSMSGNVTQNNLPLKDAVVYITSGSEVFAFGITNSNGDYVINNVPVGDYIIVCHRIGDISASINLILTTAGAENVNFNIKPVKNDKNIVTSNPVEYKLSQNYPNPFNPSTIINYDVPKEGNVSLNIYNSLGELVQRLINADQKAGAYSVTFDGAGLSSGIYFYTLEASGFVDTKRMVLIK
jgi:hypothetical protein